MIANRLPGFRTVLLICGIVGWMGGFPKSASAQGDLMIFPKRMVFEGPERAKDLTLANTGNDTTRYKISWVNYRMTPSGKFERISSPDSGQYFAENHVRFFPRTVVLAPRESQKVKLQLFRANQLDNQEYRSHLLFSPIKETNQVDSTDLSAENEKTISTKLELAIGLSIPVIIAKAKGEVEVTLSDLELSERNGTSPVLGFTIHRNGAGSVYGDFKVVHQSSTGEKTQVGMVKGVAVYTPNAKRDFLVRLALQEMIDLQQGILIVTYTEQDGSRQWAQSQLVLTP